ncbi:Rv3654c family TadE-like protein [Aeromicrobium phragmitis]|uniref:Rv3654c family TadE-like protein n=1 Tax=Aeromicrobium phragmitis TaxID=2478914 RepID=UPI001408676B|nr:Rv3654c family TadE-like protein [Aeromicrobium phragmitis]
MATVSALVVGVLLLVLGVVGWQLAELIGLRHEARAAADLAALAGSQASVEGEDGCEAAREVARENDAILADCRMDADVATVTARAESPRWWGGRWAVEQRARAAPVSYLER